MEDIEIVRRTATSKDQCETVRAELEARGFEVRVREFWEPEKDPLNYFAEIVGEKRREPSPIEIETRRREKATDESAKRRTYRRFLTFLLIFLAVAALIYLFFAAPFFRACAALF